MWYSVSELIGLPWLPADRGALIRKAKREGWENRVRSDKGGGREYHIDSLPEETRRFLLSQSNPATPEKGDKVAGLDWERIQADGVLESDPSIAKFQEEYWKAEFEGVEDRPPSFGNWFDPKFQAHREIQRAYERFIQHEADKLSAQVNFCYLYNNRALELDSSIYELIPGLSRSTLLAKRQRMRAEGITGLEDRRGWNRRGRGLIDVCPEVAEAIETCLARGVFSPSKILYLLKNYHELSVLPTEGQIRYWVKNFARNSPQKWAVYKSIDLSPAFGRRDLDLSRPNQRWELDASPTDVFLKYKDGETWKKRRFAVVACIDVFTRRVKIVVSDRSCQEAILELLKTCIDDWGLPEILKMDNGKDFKAKRVTDFIDLLPGVEIDRCTPYSPEEKPFIERFFGTFQHDILELLPGYAGHSVSERDRLRKRGSLNEKEIDLELTEGEFRAWADRWCGDYHNREHRGIGCSPTRKLAEARGEGWQPRRMENRAYLDLMAQVGVERSVRTQGIEVNSRLYVAPELLPGDRVHVRYDPKDPEKIHVYRDASLQEFVCVALWRDAVSPAELAETAERVKHEFKQVEKAAKEFQRKSRKVQKAIARDPARALTVSVEAIETSTIIEPAPGVKRAVDLPPDERDELARRREEAAVAVETAKRQECERARAERERDREIRLRKAQILQRYLKGGDLTNKDRELLEYIERGIPDSILVNDRRVRLEEFGLHVSAELLGRPKLRQPA